MSNFEVGGNVGLAFIGEAGIDFSINPAGAIRDWAKLMARDYGPALERRAANRAKEAQWAQKEVVEVRATFDRFAVRAAKDWDLAKIIDQTFPEFPERWTDVAVACSWQWGPNAPPPPGSGAPPAPPGAKALPTAVKERVLSSQRPDGSWQLRFDEVVEILNDGFENLVQPLRDATGLLNEVRDAQDKVLAQQRVANLGITRLIAWTQAADARARAQAEAQAQANTADAILRAQTTTLFVGARLLEKLDPQLGGAVAIAAQGYLDATRAAGEFTKTFATVSATRGETLGTVVSGILLAGNVVGIALNIFDAVIRLTAPGAPSEGQRIINAIGALQDLVRRFAVETFDRLRELDERVATLQQSVLNGFALVDRRLQGLEADLDAVRSELSAVRRNLDRIAGTIERDLLELSRDQLTDALALALGRAERTGKPLSYDEFTRTWTLLTLWAVTKSRSQLQLPSAAGQITELPRRLDPERPLGDQLGLIAATVAAELGSELIPAADAVNPVTWTIAATGACALVAENIDHAAAMPSCQSDLAAIEEVGQGIAQALAALPGTAHLAVVKERYSEASSNLWTALGHVESAARERWTVDHGGYSLPDNVWTTPTLTNGDVKPDELLRLLPSGVGRIILNTPISSSALLTGCGSGSRPRYEVTTASPRPPCCERSGTPRRYRRQTVTSGRTRCLSGSFTAESPRPTGARRKPRLP